MKLCVAAGMDTPSTTFSAAKLGALPSVARATAVSASLRVIFFISVVSDCRLRKTAGAVVGGNLGARLNKSVRVELVET
jgi:hypothetical protein